MKQSLNTIVLDAYVSRGARLHDTPSSLVVALCMVYAFLVPAWGVVDLHVNLLTVRVNGFELNALDALALIVIMSFFVTRKKILKNEVLSVMLFVAIAWLGFISIKAVFAPFTGHGAYQVLTLISSLAIIGVAAVIMQLPRLWIHKFLTFFLLGAATTAFASLHQLFIGNIWFHGRLTYSADANPAALGLFYALSIIICFYLRSCSVNKKLWLFFALFFMFSLILTQARNSLISLSISFLLVIMPVAIINTLSNFISLRARLIRYSSLKNAIFLVLTATVLYHVFILLTAYIDFELMTHRIFLILSGDSNQATAGRSTIWANYIAEIDSFNAMNFLFGIGSGMVYYQPISPHNTYISILFEHGLIGLILFKLLVFLLALVLFKAKNSHQLYSIYLFLFSLLIMFGNDYAYTTLWLVFALACIVRVCERR